MNTIYSIIVYTLYTLHNNTVQSTLYTQKQLQHGTVYTVLSIHTTTRAWYNVHCTLYTHTNYNIEQCTLYTVHTLHYNMIQCTLYTHCTTTRYRVHSIHTHHYSMCSVHSIHTLTTTWNNVHSIHTLHYNMVQCTISIQDDSFKCNPFFVAFWPFSFTWRLSFLACDKGKKMKKLNLIPSDKLFGVISILWYFLYYE